MKDDSNQKEITANIVTQYNFLCPFKNIYSKFHEEKHRFQLYSGICWNNLSSNLESKPMGISKFRAVPGKNKALSSTETFWGFWASDVKLAK